MNLIKLSISILILFGVTMIIKSTDSRRTGELGVFGLFLFYWIIFFVAALITAVLRVSGVIDGSSFLYILLGSGCLYLGLIGLFFAVGNIKRDILWLTLYLLTITLSLSMLADSLLFDNKNREKL